MSFILVIQPTPSGISVVDVDQFYSLISPKVLALPQTPSPESPAGQVMPDAAKHGSIAIQMPLSTMMRRQNLFRQPLS